MRLRALCRTQSHRAFLQFYQTVQRYRNTLRKDRAQFPCRPPSGLRTRLDQMTTRPSLASHQTDGRVIAMLETDKVFAGSIPENYDRYMVPLIFEPYAADLAKRAASLSPSAVFETAAGSGVV